MNNDENKKSSEELADEALDAVTGGISILVPISPVTPIT